MELNQTRGITPPETGVSFGRTLRLWLVDDKEEVRSAFADLLSVERSFRCTGSFDSVEALLEALAQGTPPDLILVDLNLGKKQSGIAAIRPTKLIAPSTCVVIMTTFTNPVAESQAFHAGADGFIRKTYDFDHLKALIHRAYNQPGDPALFPCISRKLRSCRIRSEEQPAPHRTTERHSPFAFLRQFLNVFAL